MLPNPASTLEKIKQQEFYKAKIKEAFNIVDQDRKGIVDKRYNSFTFTNPSFLRLQRNQLYHEILAAVPLRGSGERLHYLEA